MPTQTQTAEKQYAVFIIPSQYEEEGFERQFGLMNPGNQTNTKKGNPGDMDLQRRIRDSIFCGVWNAPSEEKLVEAIHNVLEDETTVPDFLKGQTGNLGKEFAGVFNRLSTRIDYADMREGMTLRVFCLEVPLQNNAFWSITPGRGKTQERWLQGGQGAQQQRGTAQQQTR